MLHKQVQGKVKKLFTELKTRNGKGKCAESGRENRATVFGAIEANFRRSTEILRLFVRRAFIGDCIL